MPRMLFLRPLASLSRPGGPRSVALVLQVVPQR